MGRPTRQVDAALTVLRSATDVRREVCRRARTTWAGCWTASVSAPWSWSAATAPCTRRSRRCSRGASCRPDRPLGLIPLGTGNDLARTLGIPLDPAAAARALLAGRPRPLDLVVDDAGGVVVNAVHLGVGAEAAEKASALKDRLGRAAYAVGSVAAGAGATGWHLQVVVDGVRRATSTARC